MGRGLCTDWNGCCSSVVPEQLQSDLSRYRTKAIYDKQNNLVRVNYPSLTSTGTCDSTLIYHVLKKQWGRNDVTVEAPLNYISPGVTIDGMDAYAATIDTLAEHPC
jgi:hypothetical protein